MKVLISAYCRNPELWQMTTLVFKTLRVGFPTADFEIWLNGEHPQDQTWELVHHACTLEGQFVPADKVPYGVRIRKWLAEATEPFVICDTDVVFFDNMETVDWRGALHGRHVPEFFCPFAAARTANRLHTHLLYFDPAEIRRRLALVRAGYPDNDLTPWMDMLLPSRVPTRNGQVFYDIAASLFHTIGGNEFTPDVLDRYAHLNCGTISDLVGPALGFNLTAAHHAVAEIPSLGRGIWRQQDEWYRQRAVIE